MSATTTRKCIRCGRLLRATKSVAAGYGPTCKAKILAAARTIEISFKPEQCAKAIELVQDAGIARISRGVFEAVSSNGLLRYKVIGGACSCKAGAYGLRCYHVAAAQILTAA